MKVKSEVVPDLTSGLKAVKLKYALNIRNGVIGRIVAVHAALVQEHTHETVLVDLLVLIALVLQSKRRLVSTNFVQVGHHGVLGLLAVQHAVQDFVLTLVNV